MTSLVVTNRGYNRSTWRLVYGSWAILVLLNLMFIIRYSAPGPIIDEWDFISAVTGEEDFWPWMWQLHNEHRFRTGLQWFRNPLQKQQHSSRKAPYIYKQCKIIVSFS